MIGFRLRDQAPPPPRRVNDEVVMRLDDIYEVEPAKMREHVLQQPMPVWDSLRIVGGRWDHLDWMHEHWADEVLSGEELAGELASEPDAYPSERRAGPRAGPSDAGLAGLEPDAGRNGSETEPG